MSAAAWLYDRRGQTEQGTHGSVRGSAWRWTQTNASSDLESLRIGSTDPELVCRHPHLGAAPPPGPRQGPRAGHGDPLELLLSFGLSPAPVVSNCLFRERQSFTRMSASCAIVLPTCRHFINGEPLRCCFTRGWISDYTRQEAIRYESSDLCASHHAHASAFCRFTASQSRYDCVERDVRPCGRFECSSTHRGGDRPSYGRVWPGCRRNGCG